MTKFAVLSDMHLTFWRLTSAGAGQRKLLHGLKQSFDKEKPDAIIDAGDLEQLDLWNQAFPEYKHIRTLGNHEYYNRDWDGPEFGCRYDEVNGVRIVSATLWTNFNHDNPVAHYVVGQSMNDFRLIKNFTTTTAYEAHLYQLEFLRKHIKNGVDIVVTHHAPSFRSAHPDYVGNPLNDGFMSDLDQFVEESKAKYWVHGHVHWQQDYMIGETRVICNPCCYPNERSTPYLPYYIEI